MSKQIQVFLCHANEDKEEVIKIYKRLQQNGIKPWMDKEDLKPGQVWDQEIKKAIKESDHVMIFFSKTSVEKRGYVQNEFKQALKVYDEIPDGQIYIIPVRLDDCEIPERFKILHYCDIFKDDGFEKVLKSIQPVEELAKEVWKVSLSDDFIDILSKFNSEGHAKSHKARDILSVTQYTVWKKLMHWGVIESPQKGVGKITERGAEFLNGEIDLPETLYILNNEVKYQSQNRIKVK